MHQVRALLVLLVLAALPACEDPSLTGSLHRCDQRALSVDIEGVGLAKLTPRRLENGSCEIGLVFQEGPEHWIGKPLIMMFSGSAERALDQPLIRQTINQCLSTGAASRDGVSCSGDLLSATADDRVPSASMSYASFEQAMCGSPYVGKPARLYPMRNTRDALWGYIDETGAWAIAPEYEQATAFSEGLATALKGQLWYLINPDGRKIRLLGLAKAVGELKLDDKTVVYPSPARAFRNNCARVIVQGQLFYMSRDGTLWLGGPSPDMREAAAAVGGKVVDMGDWGPSRASFRVGFDDPEKPSLMGYILPTGAVIEPPRWRFAGQFGKRSGLARAIGPVDDAGNAPPGWVYVDRGGTIRLPTDGTRYDMAMAFSDSFAAAKTDDAFYYIDAQGNRLKDFTFKAAYPYHDDIAFVTQGAPQEGYWINKAGETIARAQDIALCEAAWPIAQGFYEDLMQVVVAKSGTSCGEGKTTLLGGGASTYTNGEYAYLTKTGEIVLRESSLSAP